MIDLIGAVEGVRAKALELEHPPRVRHHAAAAPLVDARKLETALREKLKGEVRFDAASRGAYSTDASNYRQVPIGVVCPRDADDVVSTVKVCHEFGAPITSRGGGTSLGGQTCNVAVIIDFSKYMNRIIDIDWERKRARVQPGLVLDDLRKKAEERHLTFGPDPATHDHCTLGGMIGNNSCGMHAQMAGKVEENIEELEIVTHDGIRMRVGPTSDDELEQIIREGGRRGEIYARLRELRDRYADEIRARFPQIPRRVSGYNLNELLPENGFNVARALVGSEGTLVAVLEATCRLIWSPPSRTLAVLGFDDVYQAADAVPLVNLHKPIALEGIDDCLIEYMKRKNVHVDSLKELPAGNGWLMVEFGAETKEEADAQARTMFADIKGRIKPPSFKLIDDKEHEKKLWEVREAGLAATAHIPLEPETHPGWEDSACPPDKIGAYLRDLRKLYDKYGYRAALYGHFGQGCIHCRVDFDLKTADGIKTWKRFLHEAAELVTSYGGSLSGEHGDGQARADLLPIMFGERGVQAFQEFKSIWDPENKMNPGKVVMPYHVDENMRYGVDYEPWVPKTTFQFPDDHGSFADAADRCVGVGKCRRENSGTMCPSYMATREEIHSTRGRARLLFEMLQGNPIDRGWKSRAVFEALDLCLSCKGCKGECPVNVDMATYKAEFLSHYYQGRPRPLYAYAFGLMPWWAHLASYAPDLANIPSQTPGLRNVVKALIGIPQPRRLPPFERTPFKRWFHRRTPLNPDGPPVVLWADTWNNYFKAHTAKAAVEVLEQMGYNVIVPKAALCCGRPLYDFGMLGLARNLLHEIIDTLRPYIREGIPVVGLEPSCVSVFKGELHEMLPHDTDARRLEPLTFMLADFLQERAEHVRLPKLDRKAVVHGHCHHKSVLKFQSETEILKRLGLDLEVLDSGCCGMAGSFGFEPGGHYDVSMKCGERVLLPKVREAPSEALIVNDGFSCREQIEQNTNRHALHLAEVIKMAYERPPIEPYPERRYVPNPRHAEQRAVAQSLVAGAAAAAAGAALWVTARR